MKTVVLFKGLALMDFAKVCYGVRVGVYISVTAYVHVCVCACSTDGLTQVYYGVGGRERHNL